MYCKDCKYWKKDEDTWNEASNIELRICSRTIDLWEVKITAYTEDFEGEYTFLTRDFEGNKAFTQDGEDYKANLVTVGDFGCVQFESR